MTPSDRAIQVVQMLGSDEQRSERICRLRERAAQELTTQMGRIGGPGTGGTPGTAAQAGVTE